MMPTQSISNSDKSKIWFWLVLVVIHQAYLLFSFDGTGDDGDSLAHLFHNQFAFKYPYMFVHLWAKPVLVFSSCLFAQFGMIGMKVFNSICAISAGYLAYKYAKRLGYNNPELCIPFLMFMPRYLHHSLSALTEPLFSLMAVASLLLLKLEKKWSAALLISWLPFARPEGMFFVAAAVLYFLLIKSWKQIPVLATGHIVLSLVGVIFFEQKLLWLFTKKGYATMENKYEVAGSWMHFVYGLEELYGTPIYYLFWVGFVAIITSILLNFKRITTQYHKILLIGAIITVVGIHTIFHRYGIFGSFGLLRTIMTVSPLSAIVAVVGLNTILRLLQFDTRIYKVVKYLAVAGLFIFMYSGSVYSFKYPDDFKLTPLQLKAGEVADYIKTQLPDHHKTFYFYAQLHLELDQDPYDWKTHLQLTKFIIDQPLPSNSLVIWDDWYARVDGGVTYDMLVDNEQLSHVKSFTTQDKWGKERRLEIFKTKEWN